MRKFHLFSTFVAFLFATTNLSAVPTGALPGAFTVNSSCKMVYFSKGNLRYIANTWRFAEHQYEYFGNNVQASNSVTAPRDLFGWGTKGNPWNTSQGNEYTWQEWGQNVIVNGGNTANSGWRTLTKDEWVYLINDRTNAASLRKKSTVHGVYGLILLPDGCSIVIPSPISDDDWTLLENNGAVFLPAAGYRNGTSVSNVGYEGVYWSSTSVDDSRAYYLYFNSSGSINPQNTNPRYFGYSVRLVQDVPASEKVASVKTPPTAASDLVFDGNAHPLLSTSGEAQNGTMKYRLGSSGSFSTTIPSATAAGTYTVEYRAEGSGCITSSAIQSVNVTIANAVFENANPSATLTALYNGGNPAATDLIVNRYLWADGEYNTICLPFSLDETALAASPLAGKERLKAFKGATVTGSGQDLYIDIFVEDATAIEAGVPYLITFPAGSGDLTSLLFNGIQVTTTSPGSVSANGVTFRGIFGPTHITTYEENTDEDYLFVGSGSQLIWPNDDGSDMPGFRAYFIVDRAAGSPISLAPKGTRARIMDAPKTTTGIDELNATTCNKIIENGQLYIIKNGVKYNAQGIIVK